MKKIHLLLLGLTICLFSACHNDIWDAIDGLDSRVTKLEELCKEMNTNITSLQTIVDVLQTNDFITGVVEIKKDGEVIGYTITFGKHDPITIYHGQDGKDGKNGQNGADGKDGSTPVIGVAQDTDGVYYWTLNGEWLLDDNGNKLPVSGKDGQNGSNGSNGQDGTDGKDGQDGEDGITPQLKIEDGYWYISYDNGATWTQLGKATGEDGKDGADGEDGKDGQNGADGKDGQDGDSMFQSVTQDENYVYFTLTDGTMIKIAKDSGNNQSNDDFIFTITYDPNGGVGTMAVDSIYYGYSTEIKACNFTREGYSFFEWNTDKNGMGAPYQVGFTLSIDKDITLYAQWKEKPSSGIENGHEWVELGLSVKWATCNVGASRPEESGEFFAWGGTLSQSKYNWEYYRYGDAPGNVTKYNHIPGWGTVDNKTSLDPEDDAASRNWGGVWRMPTQAEIVELCTNCTWSWTTVNGINGYNIISKNNNKSIFLPAAGYISVASIYGKNSQGSYWSNSNGAAGLGTGNASNLFFNSTTIDGTNGESRCLGLSVRPVCP